MPQSPKSRRFEFSNNEITAFRMFERRNLGVSDSRRRIGVENLGPSGATIFVWRGRGGGGGGAFRPLSDGHLTTI